MKRRNLNPLLSFILAMILISLACSSSFAAKPTPTLTDTPAPTATPTNTPRPSPTPRPTRTPNLAATQRMDALNAEAQKYVDLGYLTTANGRFVEYEDFREEWARLSWYSWWLFDDQARNFYMSAHFKWSSAYRTADLSGCGFVFAVQDNDEHYAVFLDRSKVYFVETDYYYNSIGPIRGTGLVKFDNPFDKPVEADFTVILKDAYAYVLVDGKVAGEYTLSESKAVRGRLGLALLSGTNKDFGTRCEMTNLHAWIAY